MEQKELATALAGGMFETRFQPLVLLEDGSPAAFEVLARLNHPKLGWVSPERFVPQAEQSGLAAELARQVISSAFRDVQHAGIGALGLPFGLNLSLEVVLVPALMDELDTMRDHAALPASQLIIELTESQPVTDLGRLERALLDLRSAGYRAVIDDISPTVAGVAELLLLPFYGVKLDKSLLMSDESAAFIADVVATAKERDLSVTAEGIEDIPHWHRARRVGARLGQGFFFAEPMPAEAVPAWIASWHPPNLA